MRDPYAVLGVDRRATVSEIKAAYRALAKQWHPDRHRDEASARARFVEIGEAYQALIHPRLRDEMPGTETTQAAAAGDTRAKSAPADSEPPRETAEDMLERIFGRAAKRRRVVDAPSLETDAPAEAAAGAAEARPAAAAAEPAANAAGATAEPGPDMASLRGRIGVLSALNALFGRRAARTPPAAEAAPPAHVVPVDVPLSVVLAGGAVDVPLADGRTVLLDLPAGTLDAARLPLAPSAGTAGPAHGPVEVLIRHARSEDWWSEGADLHGTLPVDIATAILGGQERFETLDGTIRLTVPEWSGSDRVLRVKGRGLPVPDGGRGDLYVHLRVNLPAHPDIRLVDLMKSGREGFFV